MEDPKNDAVPWGYTWRSSTPFMLVTLTMATITDTFLYTFIVPILPHMLEQRIGLRPSKTQGLTAVVLAESALVSILSSPVVGNLMDSFKSKRGFLIVSMIAALLGSCCMAFSQSLFVLMLGRFFQAIADNAMWIASLAIISDTIPSQHTGKVMGFVNVAASIGTSGGPMVAGVFFEKLGYWPAWSAAFTILVFDIILRLLMLDKQKIDTKNTEEHQVDTDVMNNGNENTPLVSSARRPPVANQPEPLSGLRCYIFLLRQRHYRAAILAYICYSMLITSFDTSLPLHVRNTFNWGSGRTGLLFAALQGPALILSPLFGWLKDHMGSQIPLAVAFFCMVPIFWLLGVPGTDGIPWLDLSPAAGQAVYIMSVTMIGILICPITGIATTEATLTVQELEREHPGIFGQNGGKSRAISLVIMSWTFGTFLGPVVTGALTEKLGYSTMNNMLGIICFLSAVNSFWNIRGKWEHVSENVAEPPTC